MQSLVTRSIGRVSLELPNKAYDRLIELAPDQPMLKVQKASYTGFKNWRYQRSAGSALASLPASMADDYRRALSWRLEFALDGS